VEVAKTSLLKDLELKTAIYATAMIQEYWALNLSAKHLVVFRKPQEGQYREEFLIKEGYITPLAFADVAVSAKRLLS
jgi:Uma2 family endonuclease